MCGIVAVLPALSDRPVPSAADVLAALDAPVAASAAGDLLAAADAATRADALLRGVSGLRAMIGHDGLLDAIAERVSALRQMIVDVEAALDRGEASLAGDLEQTNAAIVQLKDAVWAIEHDRLRAARSVVALAGDAAANEDAAASYYGLHIVLSAIDRLEVRGRDSAGLVVFVDGAADAISPADLAPRNDPLFTNGAARVIDGRACFAYKAAAEIGELGDNTARLRASIVEDAALRRALSVPGARMTVLAHTRWASVGIISEPNAHPLDSDEGTERTDGAYVVGALNGDVDNHVELRQKDRLDIAPEITTDAKIIPTLVSRRVGEGVALEDAFRSTVASFAGSVAIGVCAASAPDQVMLALRGSGQALYVGLADDCFIVASEPYGLVEETSRYVRMDGEGASGKDGSSGQIIVLDRSAAGTLAGIHRLAYDGTPLPVTESDVHTAEITTRDIDRAGAPHFLLKEIGESPGSIRKTLRGKLVEDRGLLAVQLPQGALPAGLVERLANREIRTIIATGQGTAAVAAQSVAASFTDAFEERNTRVESMAAAELSGFSLRDDMSDTLVVAVSQSGTSTDTNRTVDVVRSRGATVIAIVNRRNSDLVDKSDGVLYTSDGRDVEMAVPSTKAFYAQIAAGALLAWGLAAAAGCGDRHHAAEVLEALRRLPEAMEDVLSRREAIAEVAQRHAPSHRHWAIVGNGRNRIAAAELRIKLSELTYRSIAVDITEEKKHIDLSVEPLILVCAGGLDAAIANDVAKEVAIFRAHKAVPIVIANDGDAHYDAAAESILVPAVHADLDFVLTAMAGHLFGYEAAVAIDAQARLLRRARGVLEEAIEAGLQDSELLAHVREHLAPASAAFFGELRSGALNGNLQVTTAVRLSSLLHYALGVVPLESYEAEVGKVGSPSAVIEDLLDALSDGIDELARPVDAVKHQAKTVTVGISRAESTYAGVALVEAVLAAGTTRDRIGYKALRTLAELDPAVVEVTGFSRYQVEGDVAAGTASITRVDSGGIAAGLASRTDSDRTLKGTKRRAAFEREVTVSRGARDGRTIVIVPEVKDGSVTGITLVHVQFHDRLDAAVTRRVLTGYRNRYNALVDAVTETESSFRDEVLAETDLVDLLVEPVYVLARRWRSG
jgi:glucosamine--fructose-6-phosphate aminotransferase (isomerizing)